MTQDFSKFDVDADYFEDMNCEKCGRNIAFGQTAIINPTTNKLSHTYDCTQMASKLTDGGLKK